MNYKILLPVLAFGLIFSMCSKDSSTTSHTNSEGVIESLQPANTLWIDQLAMYTQTGVVTDNTLIQGYLNRHFSSDITSHFYFNKAYVSNPGITTTLDILKNNKMQLNGKIMQIVGMQDDSVMLLSEYDSTDFPIYNNKCEILLSQVQAITPESICPSCSQYRKTYPIIISGSNYYLPVFYAAVSTSYETVDNSGNIVNTTCSLASQEFPSFNMINNNLSSSLHDNDTVIVQMARLPMTSKTQQ